MKIRSFIILACIFSIVSLNVYGQSPYLGSITVFAEGGENFTLFVNAQQINATPMANVLASNITDVPFSFRIVFENTAIPVLTQSGIRGGKDCTYSILKNKKGEYVMRVKGCTEPFPEGSTTYQSPPTANGGITQDVGQWSASYADGFITLNNGKTYKVIKSKSDGMKYPEVIMHAPVGAKVSITYDNNNERYVAEVPFDYEVKDFTNNNAYFTLTVDEGGPNRTWYVKLQNSNGSKITVE